MDISDLRNEIAHGRTVAQTASFLRRDEDEVREKMKALGLVEETGRVPRSPHRVISRITMTGTAMQVNAGATLLKPSHSIPRAALTKKAAASFRLILGGMG